MFASVIRDQYQSHMTITNLPAAYDPVCDRGLVWFLHMAIFVRWPLFCSQVYVPFSIFFFFARLVRYKIPSASFLPSVFFAFVSTSVRT